MVNSLIGKCFVCSLCLLVIGLETAMSLIPASVKHQRLLGVMKSRAGLTFGGTKRSSGLELYMSSSNDEGIKPMQLLALVVSVAGVFGFGLVGTVQKMVIENASDKSTQQKLKQTNDGDRGQLTRLTKREITQKLSAVPIFYVASDDQNGVYLDGGVGRFFLDYSDAEEYSTSIPTKKLKVTATTLSEAYFPLIVKQSKYIGEGVGASDPSAKYILIVSSKELANVPQDWNDRHAGGKPGLYPDIPLFRISNLAFSKGEEGVLDLPLFLQREDAITSFDRLNKEKQAAGKPLLPQPPQIDVTSLGDIMNLWQRGGVEGSRALELYPSVDAISKAKQLFD